MNDELKHVTEWCESYSERTKLKIFPQSAPVLAMIEDLLGVVGKHQMALICLSQSMIDINTQMKMILELTNPEEKLTKAATKVDKKEVKK